MHVSNDIFLVCCTKAARDYGLSFGTCGDDAGSSGINVECPVVKGTDITTLTVTGEWEGDCTTSYTSSASISSDKLIFEVEEGSQYIRCFQVSAANTEGDIMNIQRLLVTITVTENEGFTVSSVTVGTGTVVDGSGSLAITQSVLATQCTGNAPNIGEAVCLELTTTSTGLVGSVSAWTFNKGATTFDASTKAYTDTTGCSASGQASCQITTYLPAAFFDGSGTITSAGTASLLLSRRHLRLLSEDDPMTEAADFDTPIAVHQIEGSSGTKQGSFIALILVVLSSGMTMLG